MMRPLPLAACLALAAALPIAAVTARQDASPPPATALTGQAAAPAAEPVAAPVPASDSAPAAPAALQGNAETGRLLAYTCMGCHGVTGYKNVYPSFHVPLIGGQSREYINQALLEYRQGNRRHPTMQAQAQSLSEQDIADLSVYLSSLK